MSSSEILSFRPLPCQTTWAPGLVAEMSAQVSAVTSETRGPLVTMTSISRWSRRPVHVLRSGLASSASTSAWLRWATTFWLAFLGRMASTRAIDQACSGWRSAAWRNSEWIAASRRLRVWARVVPRLLQRREETADHLGVEVSDVQIAGPDAGPLMDIPE